MIETEAAAAAVVETLINQKAAAIAAEPAIVAVAETAVTETAAAETAAGGDGGADSGQGGNRCGGSGNNEMKVV